MNTMQPLAEVAIGAVVLGGKLTAVVRFGTRFEEQPAEPAETAEHAAVALNRLKDKLRRTCSCEPVVFLAGGHTGGPTMEAIREHDEQSVDRLVELLSTPLTCAPGGGQYANRWSEIADVFLTALHGRKPPLLALDNELDAELLAFERGERGGKIAFPSPDDVAEKIGRYPARAVATMLASIPAPAPGAQEQTVRGGHNPYACLDR